MSSLTTPSPPALTLPLSPGTDHLQLHQDHAQRYNHHRFGERSNAGSNRASQHIILEPPRAPFPATDRPSSPRHYSTIISSTAGAGSVAPRTSTQSALPRDNTTDFWVEDEVGDDDDAIILPNLAAEGPQPLTALIGWSSDALDRLDGLPQSDDSFYASLNADYASPSATFLPSPTLINSSADSQVSSNSYSVISQHYPGSNFTSNPPSNTTGFPPLSTSSSFQESFDTSTSDNPDRFFTAPSSVSTSFDMPTTTRQHASAAAEEPRSHADKRRRMTPSREKPPRGNAINPTTRTKLEQDPFAEPGTDTDAQIDKADDAPYMIDLTESSADGPKSSPEVPKEEDNRTKLAAFQCVICMDDVTTLTLTHCGHLFCAQCLHSSLHVEATKGKCPMCRQKIDMKMRVAYNSRTRGFWPLELKLMTTTRKGKRKAEVLT